MFVAGVGHGKILISASIESDFSVNLPAIVAYQLRPGLEQSTTVISLMPPAAVYAASCPYEPSALSIILSSCMLAVLFKNHTKIAYANIF